MAYTANDYQRLVEQYMNSPEGRKFLKEQKNINVGYTEVDARKIAENLKKDIIQGFLSLADDPRAQNTFDADRVAVHVNGERNGKIKITVLFRKEAIQRPSLDQIGRDDIRIGIYDIIGLFTQGYQAKDYAYGLWVRDSGSDYEDEGEVIRSRKTLVGNAFVNHIMHGYQMEYPDVEFIWPKLWGGNGK